MSGMKNTRRTFRVPSQDLPASMPPPLKLIGTITTYIGDEIPGLRGTEVRIAGVMRGALLPSVDLDADDYFVSDDATLARLGGVTPNDRVDIAHIRRDGTTSFVHCDARAIDLLCFADLAAAPDEERTPSPPEHPVPVDPTAP